MKFIRRNKDFKKNIVKILYKIIENLLYFDNDEKNLRLYIFIIMKTKIFKLIHNEMKYFDYIRIHKKLIEGLYIFNITIKFYEFIRYCSYC